MNKLTSFICIASIALFSGCGKQRPNLRAHLQHHPHRPTYQCYPYSNGCYGYQDSYGMWYYLWLTDSGTVRTVERSTYSPQSLSITIDTSRPTMERVAINEPKEGEQLEAEGAIEAQDTAADMAVDEANASIDAENAAAIEAFENEGGNLGPSSESTMDGGSSDAGSDGGSDGGSSD